MMGVGGKMLTFGDHAGQSPDEIRADIAQDFAQPYRGPDSDIAAWLRDVEFIVAAKSYEDYEGSAFYVMRKGGKLYEVTGGHCSCYGFEGQWEPEETTLAALLARKAYGYFFDYEAIQAKLAEDPCRD